MKIWLKLLPLWNVWFMRLLHIRVKSIVLTSIATPWRAIGLLKIKSKGKKTICDFKKYEANLYVHNQPPLRWVKRLVPSAQSERFSGARIRDEIMEEVKEEENKEIIICLIYFLYFKINELLNDWDLFDSNMINKHINYHLI